MPCYQYQCPKCEHEEELIHTMCACADEHLCPKCKTDMHRVIGTSFAVKPPPDSGWEYLNGGRGMECTQFVDSRYKPGDKRATRYFRSQKELIETAKREGYTTERQR